MNANGFRDALYTIIFEANTPSGKAFDVALFATIGVSVTAIMLESVPSIAAHQGASQWFKAIELITTLLFTIEYVLRLWCSPKPGPYARSFYAFIFMTNNDSYYKRRTPNKHALDVVRVMEQLSKEHDAAVWDLFGVMGGLNSIVLWEEHRLAKSDKIHLTRAGYRLNSDLLFWAFWEAYEQHLKALAP